MSVIIRCLKTGANNYPSFRIVAADIHAPRDGKALETMGWYDPKKKNANFFINLERIEAWQKQGALLSALVKTLVRKARAGGMAPGPAAPAA